MPLSRQNRLLGEGLPVCPTVSVSQGVRSQPHAPDLKRGLMLAVQEYPLPYMRRTILEFVLPGDEGLAWRDGLSGLCAGYALNLHYLEQSELQVLTRWIFSPVLG